MCKYKGCSCGYMDKILVWINLSSQVSYPCPPIPLNILIIELKLFVFRKKNNWKSEER